MKVKKSTWKYGSQAPVMFMIDDLANKYIEMQDSQKNIKGCDWGAKAFEKNSFYSILQNEILKKFPYIKTTMFLVVGRREPIINRGRNFYSESMDKNKEFIKLIKFLSDNEMFEIAYHGYTHGQCSDDIYKFQEEWETFNSLDKALKTIRKGKDLYKSITNRELKGGKYCGYKYNEISDDSIIQSNFLWWCRHWDGEAFFSNQKDISLELEEFGGVIDIPSNIDGSFYSIKNYKKLFTKKYLKSIYIFLKKGITIEKEIDYLVENQFVVSIQEHTAPYRVDNRTQYPNIVSDSGNLDIIFRYLKKYNLWYATGTEIAIYYKVYRNTILKFEDNIIEINVPKELNGNDLTIEIECEAEELYLYNNEEKIKLRKLNDRFIGEIIVEDGKRYIVNMKVIGDE